MTLYHKLKLYRILLPQLLRYCSTEVRLDLRQKVNKDFSLGKLFVFSLWIFVGDFLKNMTSLKQIENGSYYGAN